MLKKNLFILIITNMRLGNDLAPLEKEDLKRAFFYKENHSVESISVLDCCGFDNSFPQEDFLFAANFAPYNPELLKRIGWSLITNNLNQNDFQSYSVLEKRYNGLKIIISLLEQAKIDDYQEIINRWHEILTKNIKTQDSYFFKEIIFSSKKEAEEVFEKIKTSADFDKIAKERSFTEQYCDEFATPFIYSDVIKVFQLGDINCGLVKDKWVILKKIKQKNLQPIYFESFDLLSFFFKNSQKKNNLHEKKQLLKKYKFIEKTLVLCAFFRKIENNPLLQKKIDESAFQLLKNLYLLVWQLKKNH